MEVFNAVKTTTLTSEWTRESVNWWVYKMGGVYFESPMKND